MPRFSATEDFQAVGRPYHFRPVALSSNCNVSDVLRHICDRVLHYDPTLTDALHRHLQNHVKSLVTKPDGSKFLQLLTDAELFAVVWYTSDVRRVDPEMAEEQNWWHVINAALRAGDELVVKQHSEALSLLLSACQKLARAISETESKVFEFYRGMKGIKLENFTIGDNITWPAFSSASLDPEVALSFCGESGGTLLKIVDEHQSFAIFGTLSEFPNEQEVVFLPGTVIRVQRTFRAGSSGIKTYLNTASVPDCNLVVCKVVATDSHAKLGRSEQFGVSAPPRIKPSDLIGELLQLSSNDGVRSLSIDRELLSAVVSGGALRTYRPSALQEPRRSVSPNPRPEVKLDRGIKNPWNRFQHEYVRIHSGRQVTKEELVDAYYRWKDGESVAKEVSKSTAPSTKAASVAQANSDSDRRDSLSAKKPTASSAESGKDVRSSNSWNDFQAEHKGQYTKAEMLEAYHERHSPPSQPSQSPPARSHNPTPSTATPNNKVSESAARSSNAWNDFQAEHKGQYTKPEMLDAYRARNSMPTQTSYYSAPASSSNPPTRSYSPPAAVSTGQTSNSWNDFQAEHKGQYTKPEMLDAYRARNSMPTPSSYYSPPASSYTPPARSYSPPSAVATARSSNSWNDFQAQNKGQYSRPEMLDAYRARNSMPAQTTSYSPPARSYTASSYSPPASSGSTGRSSNSWNDFQAQHKGQYSRAEMKQAYQKSKR
jgi:hypothetical protein